MHQVVMCGNGEGTLMQWFAGQPSDASRTYNGQVGSY